jgi:uncharacterized membrane protein
MSDSTNDKTMFLYVGAYTDEASANQDFDALKELHNEGWVGTYDAGIVAKEDDGKLNVKRHTDSTGKGARRGLAVGVLLGVVFPPSIILSGVVGATAGATIGHHFNDISKDDLKELGDFLENNEAALVVIGESKVEDMINKVAKQAVKEYKKEFNADVKEYNEELDKAIKEM